MSEIRPQRENGSIPFANIDRMIRRPAMVCAALAIAVFLVYTPALKNGFVGYDDPEYVTGNPHVNTGLTPQNAAWAFTAVHSSNWHPLTWISHALDCTIFGLNPWGHHFTNVLLHVGNTLLLFLWLNSATGFTGRSAFVAGVFGLHPLHVESVAWIAERKDVLSTLFWMLALIAYTAYARKPGVVRYAIVTLLLAIGLLAKQMLVTLPVVFLLIDWWPLARRRKWMSMAIEKAPLLLLSALASGAVLWAQRQSGSAPGVEDLPVALRLSNAAVSYVTYLGETFWPTGLAVLYPFPLGGLDAWKVAASALAIAAISGLAILTGRRRPWLAVGWFWYVLTLVPVIGIVQVGMQARADRYMYVPMVGIIIAVAWAASESIARIGWRAQWLALPATALLSVLAFLSWAQIGVWKDGLTLFTRALEVTDNNFIAHNNVGVELDRRERFDEALVHYRHALRIKPGDRRSEENLAQASFAKGERLFRQGDLEGAMASLNEGFRYRPTSAVARVQAGMILSRQRRFPEAIANFRRAIESDPKAPAAHLGLGIAHISSGNVAEARAPLAEAVRLDPSNAEAQYNLGLALISAGRHREAIAHFNEAVRLKPDFGAAHLARAITFFGLGQYTPAFDAMSAAKASGTPVDAEFAAAVTKLAGK